jgi:iron complex transport system substrate-binding protein
MNQPPNEQSGEHMLNKSTTLLAGAIFAFGLGSNQVFAEATQYPLTLDNCGRQITIAHAPKSTVAIGQSTTEILYILGLADKVSGTAGWLGPVLKEYEGVNAGVKRLADYEPSFESVLAAKPDLVTVQFEYFVGPEGVWARTSSSRNSAFPSIPRRQIASARTMPAAVTACAIRCSTWN